MKSEPNPSSRAHYVREPALWVGGCSDTGLRHHTNQDAMSMAVRSEPSPAAVVAVADGVSTARGSELASLVAAETAVEVLIRRRAAGSSEADAFVEAFEEANRAVVAAHDDPSACTLIAATVEDGLITVANVGDSRAYWLGDDAMASQLSTDDSLAQARILLGMTRAEAEQSIQAHAITKWLGRQASDVTPSVVTLRPTCGGWLLLCTDGLWNYASSPEAMARLVAGRTGAEGAGSLAEELALWANSQGGKDNVTVILVRLEP
ncbi:protein serine/threonine phosphatase 2C family protein [Tessaracoccus sp. MC1627]|uniref:PP2C family protein-serine/threonine phosphatase n=1 Tax=Tessaracoccus sp. MC1627 TaxID=2760312 RepID=UPI0016047BED|nr:protein phosphatase 2C domain-containing protein [Tessaracoccus sp. MC1627]MBB1512896.1 protein serine/threonine phosphatase 2C family protein [Tessaracoccus sp. MC1627]